jgi:hypothetical protein
LFTFSLLGKPLHADLAAISQICTGANRPTWPPRNVNKFELVGLHLSNQAGEDGRNMNTELNEETAQLLAELAERTGISEEAILEALLAGAIGETFGNHVEHPGVG